MFLLKKVISQGLYPLPIISFLLIISLILLVQKRNTLVHWVVVAITLLVLFFSYDISGMVLASGLEKTYPVLTAQQCSTASYIVVLGGGSIADQSLPVASQLHRATLGRVVEGVMLWRQMPEATLITTGGALLDTVSIAELSRRVAVSLGVDSTKILMADKALDTPMEALAVKKIVGDSTIVLVTSALHLPRATYLFEQAGVSVLPYPVDFRVKKAPFTLPDLFPNSYRITIARDAIHERVGMIWARLRH